MKLVKSTALLAAVFSASSMAALSDSATGTVNANVVEPVEVAFTSATPLNNVEVETTVPGSMLFNVSGTLSDLSLVPTASCTGGQIALTNTPQIAGNGDVLTEYDFTAPEEAGDVTCSIELVAQY